MHSSILNAADTDVELTTLIDLLYRTEKRLEELTVGEVDSVMDRDGRTLVLQGAQESLRDREAARQVSLLDALPAHIALIDSQGLIVTVNQAWQQFSSAHVLQGLGYRIGSNYLEICRVGGNDSFEANQVAEGIQSVLSATAASYSIEYTCDSQTEQRWFLLSVTPLANDPPNGAIVMHMDVTAERRRDIVARERVESGLRAQAAVLEERVQERTGQLEALNKELEAFSYSVSHDLRAPLRQVRGFADILKEEYVAETDVRARRLLQNIEIAVKRMSDLIEALLQLAKPATASFKRSSINLSAHIRSVAADFRRTEPSRQVRWEIAENVLAHADPELARIVLDNLVANAWKFTAYRPDACIEFGVSAQSDGSSAYFFRDNGAGFDMRYAETLFGAFRRLHSDSEFAGTGIGLAIVQRVVHRHGGRVWAEGEVGKGATFWFTLSESVSRPVEAEGAQSRG